MYEIVTQQNMENYKITLKENNTGRDDSVDTRPENGSLAPMKKASVSFCAWKPSAGHGYGGDEGSGTPGACRLSAWLQVQWPQTVKWKVIEEGILL